MYKLFSYGTLCDEEIQLRLFGKVPNSYSATLHGYSINIAEEYFNIFPDTNGKVSGRILLLDSGDLLLADQWEEVPLYIKKFVMVESNKGLEKVYVYIKSITDEQKIHLKNPGQLSNNENIMDTVNEFIAKRDQEIPVSDVYLLYPIKFNSNHLSKMSNNCIGTDLYITNTIAGKFESMNHIYLCSTYITVPSADSESYASLYYTVDQNGIGVLFISFAVSFINPSSILTSAYCNNLKIQDTLLNCFLLNEYGITIISKPRIGVFSSKPWTSSDIYNLFTIKDCPIDEHTSYSISQYKSTSIYTSSSVVLEISAEFAPCYEERLKSQIPALLNMEISIFQSVIMQETKNKK